MTSFKLSAIKILREAKEQGVVKVFSDTTHELIQHFQSGHKPIQSSDMILAIKEYEEFDDLKIDLEDMERVFQEEFGSKILKVNNNQNT